MQKVLLSAAAAAAFSLASFPAAAVTQNGAFIGVSGGKTHYSVSHSDTNFNDNNDTAFGAVAGYRWVVDRPFSLGVEAGYVDLGRRKASQGYITYSFDDKYKAQAVVVGANGKWDLPHGFTITARAGFARVRSKLNETYTTYDYLIGGIQQTTYRFHDSSNDNGIYAGLGFGYDFNENIGITLIYDHYTFKVHDLGDRSRVNVGTMGAALEYRFW
jgi:OmpA-OmpF porin, OOP family